MVAVANNDVIGFKGDIPWQGKLKGDQALFKEHTLNKAVIMGRKTWDSIPEKYRPLPNRMNIVLTSDEGESVPGRFNCGSLQDGIDLAILHGYEEVVLMGGERIYKEGMPLCDKMYITHVNASFEGDTFFSTPEEPEYSIQDVKHYPITDSREYSFDFFVLVKQPVEDVV